VDQVGARWRTVGTMLLLVVFGKGLAFLREAFVASQLGASASSDGYYLALALPTLVYSLGALPFSMWVTARLATLRDPNTGDNSAAFYSRMLGLVIGIGAILAGALVVGAKTFVHFYAPGLDPERLNQTGTLTQISALAIPALGAQAICNGRLFSDGRFVVVYAWLVISSVVGLGVVIGFAPQYGAAAAVAAFVAAAWASIVGPLILTRPRLWTKHPSPSVVWEEDLRYNVVYRALVMQLFFQGSIMLVYGFGSMLPPGEVAAALFGNKVQNALYEIVAVTAGVLVYPQIARLIQARDAQGVKSTIMNSLEWLLPLTAGLVVLLIVCRTEIVALIYERKRFDARAVDLVSAALFGYAPGVVGLTLVEILHRTMVLRGRLKGYLVLFSAALGCNLLACLILVPTIGVAGLTFASSLGVLVASGGFIWYAARRLESFDSKEAILLVTRTTFAAVFTLLVLTPVHHLMQGNSSLWHQVLTVGGVGLATACLLTGVLLALGHRWRTGVPMNARAA